jgi:hypothetical protein
VAGRSALFEQILEQARQSDDRRPRSEADLVVPPAGDVVGIGRLDK